VSFALRRFRALGGEPVLRYGSGKLGPVISDLGNPIIDVHFGVLRDPERLNHDLNSIPGIVGHGLFINMTHDIIVAKVPLDEPIVEHRTLARQPKR
jgi:ribose 5-phosphate isomerase